MRYIKTKISLPETKKRKLTNSSEYYRSCEEGQAINYEFDLKRNCIICTKRINPSQSYSTLTRNESKQIVINHLRNDEAINPVIRDIIVNKFLCEEDLTLINAMYHRKSCTSKLRVDLTPRKNTKLRQKIQTSMEEIFNFIDDNEENQFNIDDFRNVLLQKEKYLPSNKTIWTKLRNHYQEEIVIINRSGDQGFYCLRKKQYDILEFAEDKFHYQLIDKVVTILFKEIKEYNIDDFFNEYPVNDSTNLEELQKI